MTIARLTATCIALFSACTLSHAALTITVTDVGGEAVFSGTGAINLTGLTPGATGAANGYIFSGVGEANFNIASPGSAQTLRIYSGGSAGGVFGDASPVQLTTNTGDLLLLGSPGTIGLLDSYSSNDPITIDATAASFDGMLLTPGDYTWTLPSDTITLSIVPEPSTYAALAGLGILGLATWQRKRRA